MSLRLANREWALTYQYSTDVQEVTFFGGSQITITIFMANVDIVVSSEYNFPFQRAELNSDIVVTAELDTWVVTEIALVKTITEIWFDKTGKHDKGACKNNRQSHRYIVGFRTQLNWWLSSGPNICFILIGWRLWRVEQIQKLHKWLRCDAKCHIGIMAIWEGEKNWAFSKAVLIAYEVMGGPWWIYDFEVYYGILCFEGRMGGWNESY